MSNDVQPDEVIEENLVVVNVLCLDSREVQKQVCCALALSVSCNRDRKIAFGDGIQYKLIQLVHEGLVQHHAINSKIPTSFVHFVSLLTLLRMTQAWRRKLSKPRSISIGWRRLC